MNSNTSISRITRIIRNTRSIALIAALATTTLLTGCAGLQVGPGTTTGAGIGAVIGGLSSRDPVGGIVRGGIIGGAIGAIGDAVNGVPPVQSGDYYDRDGRYYDNRPYHNDRPIIIERRQPQPYWDNYCGCRRYR